MMRMPLKRWIPQGALLAGSFFVAGFLAEGLARLVVNPVDYLLAHPVFDSVLGGRLEPHDAGHDKWGFRNHEVPEQADIVTIGDSQTYGVGAPAQLSWPAQLAELTGLTVYNASLGGYSPVQYREVLRRIGLPLRPSSVIAGFYYGNDLWEAHRTVYGLSHWASLRRPGIPPLEEYAEPVGPDRRPFGPLRDWLARHSIVYRLFTASIAGTFARRVELAVDDHEGRDLIVFREPASGAVTAFTPRLRLRALDLDSAGVREGLRLSLEQLGRMALECSEAGVRFLVVLIPTKERVFQLSIEANPEVSAHESLRTLLRNENQIDREVRQFLDQRRIPYLDLVEPLRRAALHRAIYPPTGDGHPTGDGYAVIARAVARAIGASANPVPAGN